MSTEWPLLDSRFRLRPTSAFSVVCLGSGSHDMASKAAATRACRGVAEKQEGEASDRHGYGVVCIDVVCPYTRELVVEGFRRRRAAWRVTTDSAEATLHWGDYEMIDWGRVVSGELRASSYCVRKGMSRKAQLSRYCNKYALKRPETPLKAALPRTLVIDTWEAFDDNMTFNLGGDIAAFGSDLGVRQSVSLATRLDWCLSDAQEWVDQTYAEDHALGSKPDAEVETGDSEMTPSSTEKEDNLGLRIKADRKESVSATAARCMREGSAGRRRRWILKPSTLNKGANLAFGEGFEPLRKAIHESPDIREWVLQEYVDRPLLVQGRKFHLRAYVLAVGCIRVYLFEDVLLLRAAKRYPSTSVTGVPNERDGRRVAFGDEDPLAHITNTARQAEDDAFVEEDNVLLLEDLVGELEKQGLTFEGARAKVDRIFSDLEVLTAELFRAFRGEFTVFSPLPGCFEHFGLDFMVDEDFHVWLLEANPGPDFKQTGSRLKSVVAGVIECTMQICLDQATQEGASLGTEGGATRGFRAILDEQWQGMAARPSMKML